MWVWSDELTDRFPSLRGAQNSRPPLIAYAVERETDLEAFAREILDATRGLDRSQLRQSGVSRTHQR